MMHTSEIDIIKEVKFREPPKAFQRSILALAGIIVIALLIIATVDSKFLPW
jgi:hypothetical protein